MWETWEKQPCPIYLPWHSHMLIYWGHSSGRRCSIKGANLKTFSCSWKHNCIFTTFSLISFGNDSRTLSAKNRIILLISVFQESSADAGRCGLMDRQRLRQGQGHVHN